MGGAFDFFVTTNAHRAPFNRPPTARRRQWRSTCGRTEVCPSTRRPSNLPIPTPAGTYGNPNRQPGGRHPTGVPAHQGNGFCNNYSVISTRLCLFNHNRHRALSMTCSPTPRPKFRPVFQSTYISIRTIIPAQNVPRGTLYVQPWATRSAEVVEDEDMRSKGTGPVGGGPAPTSGLYFRMLPRKTCCLPASSRFTSRFTHSLQLVDFKQDG
jgi:hypothetical protein